MSGIKNQTMTITMTVEQFDMARYSLRTAAKKRLRDADHAKYPELVEKNWKYATKLRGVIEIIDREMRRQVGEADYIELGLDHARMEPS